MRSPILYLPHGGGPMPLLGDPGHASLTAFLKQVPELLGQPRAILVVSAHWEETTPSVTAGANPELIYDYYGFPPESYEVTYPAPGAVAVAQRVRELLTAGGVSCEWREDRGYDHGLFVPLKLMYPQAEIPCLQVSLLKSLNPEQHLRLGELLAPLRDEGVLIVGSGLSFHNMRAYGRNDPQITADSQLFDNWLNETCTSPELPLEQRRERLAHWEQGPHARFCHPREEHLLPLQVCAAAGEYRPAKQVYNDLFLGTWVSAFLWD